MVKSQRQGGLGAVAHWVTVLAAFVFSSACADRGSQIAAVSSGVIYGQDSREELAQSEFASLGAITVALMPRANLQTLTSRGVADWPDPIDPRPMCANQRYREQPRAASCGGIAIAPQYVLTASHCIPDEAACRELAFVRNYALNAEGQLATDQLDVYECDLVKLSVKSDLLASEALDFTIAHLSRPIQGFDRRAIALGSPVPNAVGVTVGPSGGLPLKVSTGRILEVNSVQGLSRVAIDFFAGGSGSGLFDERGLLLGILVAGAQDYVEEPEGCLSARVIAEDESSGELANSIDSILGYSCAEDRTLPLCLEFFDVRASGASCAVSRGTPALRGSKGAVAASLATLTALLSRRRRRRAARRAEPRSNTRDSSSGVGPRWSWRGSCPLPDGGD